MGMNKHVFQELLHELLKVGLHDTRYVSAEEQFAIFLFLAVTGLPQRHLEECFQRSPDTISKYVNFIFTAVRSTLTRSEQFIAFLIYSHQTNSTNPT
jgi:hypothetical protein